MVCHEFRSCSYSEQNAEKRTDPDSETKIPDSETNNQTTLLEAMGDGGGDWGGWGGGGGVITCIPNQGVIV